MTLRFRTNIKELEKQQKNVSLSSYLSIAWSIRKVFQHNSSCEKKYYLGLFFRLLCITVIVFSTSPGLIVRKTYAATYTQSMEWLSLESKTTPVGVNEAGDMPDIVIAPQPMLSVPELTTLTFQFPLQVIPKLTTVFSSAHPGVDLAVPEGSVILASETGLVTEAGWSTTGYGLTVVLHHNATSYTRYAHLSVLSVTTGQYILKGSEIGQVGCTGRCTGPHLHFEVRVQNQFVDPLSLLHD